MEVRKDTKLNFLATTVAACHVLLTLLLLLLLLLMLLLLLLLLPLAMVREQYLLNHTHKFALNKYHNRAHHDHRLHA